MIKRAVVYPFLFILYLILNPLVHNFEQVDPQQAARPLIVLFLVAAGGMLLLYFFLKDWQYAGYLIFLGLVFLFVFGHLNHILQEWLPVNNQNLASLVLLVIWGILLATLGLRRLWTRFGAREWMPPLLNITLALALIVPISIAPGQLLQNLQKPPQASTPTEVEEVWLDCTAQPDVYYIVVDGYSGADVLDGLYGLDNSSFLDYLASKGFYVASESHTNYIQTIFSLPSALSFTYFDPPSEGVNGVEYFTQLMADNRIMSLLKQCGYQMVAFDSGFFYSNLPEVEVYLSRGNGLSEFENLLLAGSPVEVLAGWRDAELSEFSHQAHRERVLYSFKKLMALPKMPGPKFVFAHIISPHPPFVFDENGQSIEPGGSYSTGDGNNFSGDREEYRRGYAGQVRFVNQKLEKVVDAILSRSSKPPIIIIQGDHGPGSFLKWESPDRSCLWERTSILNAYYLPNGGRDQLYPTISPVNSFRVILNTYFGGSLELLADRSYFTSHALERQSIDITGERNSRENCVFP